MQKESKATFNHSLHFEANCTFNWY